MTTTGTTPHPLATSRLLLIAIFAVSVWLVGVSAVKFQAPAMLGAEKVLTDFDAFHIAGTLAREGRAADAYGMKTMLIAQREAAGTTSFMPWTYPPPFTLFVSALAALPIGIAYALFTGISFTFYLLVLHRIAGPHLTGVLIAIIPTLVLTLGTGQNGFLTGGLIGLFLLAFLGRRPSAGIPLGIMIIKPHLAVGIALVTLLERRWHAMALAAAVVAVALLAPTLVFGMEIWTAFLNGVRESGVFLAEGLYPMFRMTSLYAMARTFGLSAQLAMAVHGLGALLTVGLFIALWRRNLPPRMLAATVCVTSLFISPYNYDYDLTILGVGIAFVIPDILKHARPAELALLLGLCWLATGYGVATHVVLEMSEQSVKMSEILDVASIMAPLLLLLVCVAARILNRRPAFTADPLPA